jgi:hypothetical protein
MDTAYPKKNTLITGSQESGSKTGGSGKSLGRAAHSLLGGTFLTRERVIRTLPFILYLAFLALLYITNSYYSQRDMIAIERLKKELKELNYNYISTKSELMFISRQSEVSKKAAAIGLKETTVPAYQLGISGDNKRIKRDN